jgi:hypothetical protein
VARLSAAHRSAAGPRSLPRHQLGPWLTPNVPLASSQKSLNNFVAVLCCAQFNDWRSLCGSHGLPERCLPLLMWPMLEERIALNLNYFALRGLPKSKSKADLEKDQAKLVRICIAASRALT